MLSTTCSAQEVEQDDVLRQALQAVQDFVGFLKNTVEPMLVDPTGDQMDLKVGPASLTSTPEAKAPAAAPSGPFVTPCRLAAHAPPRPVPSAGPQNFYVGEDANALNDRYLTLFGMGGASVRPVMPKQEAVLRGPSPSATGAVLFKAAVRANSRSAPCQIRPREDRAARDCRSRGRILLVCLRYWTTIRTWTSLRCLLPLSTLWSSRHGAAC